MKDDIKECFKTISDNLNDTKIDIVKCKKPKKIKEKKSCKECGSTNLKKSSEYMRIQDEIIKVGILSFFCAIFLITLPIAFLGLIGAGLMGIEGLFNIFSFRYVCRKCGNEWVE